jgi:hypothetical protein
MSFDLYLWGEPIPKNQEEGLEICQSLGETSKPVVKSCPRLFEFLTDLVALYPGLEDFSDEEVDENGVWSMSPELNHGWISLTIARSRLAVVVDDVVRLAEKYKLVLFDPQFGMYSYFPNKNQHSGGLL